MSAAPTAAPGAAPAAARTAPPQLSTTAAGQLAAHGALTFATARRALALGGQLRDAADTKSVEIDCSAVTASDSAGLAVLLEWLGTARRTGRTLRYTHLPQGLTALARISEVEELLTRGV
ncbi:MAG TPA: STAS domain-containing protein [Steroidobacteraceae bacterium]|jgi:phospholipid transport system transporter-binding protein|nr:STAS domain-containing protein [Steroidobacteraceae bacterium]